MFCNTLPPCLSACWEGEGHSPLQEMETRPECFIGGWDWGFMYTGYEAGFGAATSWTTGNFHVSIYRSNDFTVLGGGNVVNAAVCLQFTQQNDQKVTYYILTSKTCSKTIPYARTNHLFVQIHLRKGQK